MEDPEFVEFGN